jgi:hypothetical protein
MLRQRESTFLWHIGNIIFSLPLITITEGEMLKRHNKNKFEDRHKPRQQAASSSVVGIESNAKSTKIKSRFK